MKIYRLSQTQAEFPLQAQNTPEQAEMLRYIKEQQRLITETIDTLIPGESSTKINKPQHKILWDINQPMTINDVIHRGYVKLITDPNRKTAVTKGELERAAQDQMRIDNEFSKDLQGYRQQAVKVDQVSSTEWSVESAECDYSIVLLDGKYIVDAFDSKVNDNDQAHLGSEEFDTFKEALEHCRPV